MVLLVKYDFYTSKSYLKLNYCNKVKGKVCSKVTHKIAPLPIFTLLMRNVRHAQGQRSDTLYTIDINELIHNEIVFPLGDAKTVKTCQMLVFIRIHETF